MKFLKLKAVPPWYPLSCPGKSRFPSPLLAAFSHLLALLDQHMGLPTGLVPLLEMVTAYFRMSQSIYVACNDAHSLHLQTQMLLP